MIANLQEMKRTQSLRTSPVADQLISQRSPDAMNKYYIAGLSLAIAHPGGTAKSASSDELDRSDGDQRTECSAGQYIAGVVQAEYRAGQGDQQGKWQHQPDQHREIIHGDDAE